MRTQTYILSEIEKQNLVKRMRESNGAAKVEIARELGIKYPNYVLTLYRRITGHTLSADGFGRAHRWAHLRAHSAENAECLPKELPFVEGVKHCRFCGILIPVDLPHCEDHVVVNNKLCHKLQRYCTNETVVDRDRSISVSHTTILL